MFASAMLLTAHQFVSELQISKYPHVSAGRENLVLRIGNGIADFLIQQIVADDSDRYRARSESQRIETCLVAQLGPEEIVAIRRRFNLGNALLREGMKKVDARKPVGVAIEQSSANSHGRNPGHVGAVRELGAHNVELALYAIRSIVNLANVDLSLKLAARKGGVSLTVNSEPTLMGVSPTMLMFMFMLMRVIVFMVIVFVLVMAIVKMAG